MVDMVASRIGRKPVLIPSGVEVKVINQELLIKGPKGQMKMPLHSTVKVEIEGNKTLHVGLCNDGYVRRGTGSRLKKAIAGTTRAKINNMVEGVLKGFERKLVLVGVGYRAAVKGKALNLTIGYSHPVSIDAPEGVTFETPSVTEIIIKGMDKHLIGHIASKIRAVRPPEPYKGKGIRYADEVVDRKETKKK